MRYAGLLSGVIYCAIYCAALLVGDMAWAKLPPGVMNCSPSDQADCDNFWARQSDEAKQFILSFKGDDRNAALTCYALHGYGKITEKTRDCARTLIGDRKSMAHCEKQGHELMSEKMVRCQNAYRRKHGYPLPY